MENLNLDAADMLKLMQTPSYHLDGLRTLVIDAVDQEERLPLLRDKLQRCAGRKTISLLGIVEPQDHEIEDWADIHVERSILRLDDERENIAQRLIDESLVAVIALGDPKHVIDRYARTRRLETKRQGYAAVPESTWERARAQTPLSGGRSRTNDAARWTATLDYHGSLGGGSPGNPMRVNSTGN